MFYFITTTKIFGSCQLLLSPLTTVLHFLISKTYWFSIYINNKKKIGQFKREIGSKNHRTTNYTMLDFHDDTFKKVMKPMVPPLQACEWLGFQLKENKQARAEWTPPRRKQCP
jgi:hypothetical protein